MEPTPIEYIADHGVLFVIMVALIGFAVIGIFASVEEITFRLRRRRYRKAHDMRRRTKWVKNPRTKP
jgi:hypothetical protein